VSRVKRTDLHIHMGGGCLRSGVHLLRWVRVFVVWSCGLRADAGEVASESLLVVLYGWGSCGLGYQLSPPGPGWHRPLWSALVDLI